MSEMFFTLINEVGSIEFCFLSLRAFFFIYTLRSNLFLRLVSSIKCEKIMWEKYPVWEILAT
jgi:hypothetical protein